MSVLSLLASTPQISSLRRARDLIDECKRLGLKIVPDEEHEVAAAKLCRCGEAKPKPLDLGFTPLVESPIQGIPKSLYDAYLRNETIGDHHGQ